MFQQISFCKVASKVGDSCCRVAGVSQGCHFENSLFVILSPLLSVGTSYPLAPFKSLFFKEFLYVQYVCIVVLMYTHTSCHSLRH